MDGEDTRGMDFGEAIKYLKGGGKVLRSGWDGGLRWLELDTLDELSKMTTAYIYIRNVDGDSMPWSPSQNDILHNDWLRICPSTR